MVFALQADSPDSPCRTIAPAMPTPLSFPRATWKGRAERRFFRTMAAGSVFAGLGISVVTPMASVAQSLTADPSVAARSTGTSLPNTPAEPTSPRRQGLQWELVDSETYNTTTVPSSKAGSSPSPSAPHNQSQARSSTESASTELRASRQPGLTWELVTPEGRAESGSQQIDVVAQPSAKPDQAAPPSSVGTSTQAITASNQPSSTGIDGRPGWEWVKPGEEFNSSDVAKEIEEREAARSAAAQTVESGENEKLNPPGRPMIMGMSKAFTVNRTVYPDTSITVPNGFKRDPKHFFSASLIGTDEARRPFIGCRGDNTCRDAELEAELALLQAGPASLELLYNVASLGYSTSYSYQTLGFRLAANIAPNIGLAFGGESLVYLDKSSNERCSIYDSCAPFKGTSWFAVASAAFPLQSKSPTPPVIVLTAGAGNGYYGYDGSGDDQQWGPIGSISFALNQHVSFSAEYTGYGISAGISAKPFEFPLVASFFVTDFLGNTPSHIKDSCPDGSCSARLLGRLTFSF